METLIGGSLDPPAFHCAKKEKMAKSLSQGCANESSDFGKSLNAACVSQEEELCASEPESIGYDDEQAAEDGECNESDREDDISAKTQDESESLSDIDDLEVNVYLHNEEERHYKKIIWEKINWEYLKEQAAKEAAGKKGGLDTSATASVAKSQKGKKQRQTQAAKSLGPAQSTTDKMLTKKRLSSKVNFEMVEKLFNEPVGIENPKKARLEQCPDNHDNLEHELECKNRSDEVVPEDDEFENTDDMGFLNGDLTWLAHGEPKIVIRNLG
ncbi:transcription factor IIIB 90 kDa subunit isoform X1 [Senna tora]|uniref:Transcription factor IIIB 90 kDa subunit isoform X1 n=1 Tax=Senna tora TaxID=362788 RepID=A0A834SD82_9FABA|nr:transcription factor IIIB 90 kDa subunit isoform X1 [Senna tora]